MTEHEPSLPAVDPGAPLQAEECFSLLHDVPSDFAYADRVAPDGTVTPEWTTKGFTRITGYTCDELVQREEGFVIVHPDDLPILNEHVRQALATWANTVEVRIVTKWGDIRWIRSHLHPVWDAGEERVVRLRGWGEDITDRKLAEADRRLWTSVVEQLGLPLCVWQLHSRTDASSFRLRAANRAFEQLVGAPESKLVGRPVAEAFPGLASSDLLERWRDVVLSGVPAALGDFALGDEHFDVAIFAVKAFPLPDLCVGLAFDRERLP